MAVIHIGFRKCASTSIQRFLADNAAELRISHKIDASPLHEVSGLAAFLEGRTPAKQKSRDFRKRLARDASDKLMPLLTDEMLETLSDTGVRHLAKFVGRDSTIIAVLRDPRDLLVSIYKFRVLRGINVSNFDAFSKPILDGDDRRLWFHETLCRWAAVFGWYNIRVVMLGSKTQPDIYRSFMSAVSPGIDMSSFAIPQPKNTTLGWRPTEYLRARFKSLLSSAETRRDYGSAKEPLVRRVKRLGAAMQPTPYFASKGDYLTKGQINRLARLFESELSKIERDTNSQLLNQVEISAGDRTERAFLPSMKCLTREDRRALAAMLE